MVWMLQVHLERRQPHEVAQNVCGIRCPLSSYVTHMVATVPVVNLEFWDFLLHAVYRHRRIPVAAIEA